MATPSGDPETFRRSLFNLIAPNYAIVTGNSTRDTFAQLLEEQDLGITDSSVIHDNAAGPGTATEALVSWCAARSLAPKIVVTDYIPAMIDNFAKVKSDNEKFHPKIWRNIEASVVDAADLSRYSDGEFTHSICNFSIFAFGELEKSVREIRRTLQPGGVAVFTAWKRFAVGDVMSFAQDHIKGSGWAAAHPLPVQGVQFMEEGYMARAVARMGFEEANLTTSFSTAIIKEGKDWDGLFGFMISQSSIAMPTTGWTEDEVGKWPEAIKAAMLEEKKNFGGVKFEAWNVVARV